MGSNKQSPLERTAQFQPPWRERNPDGSLGREYGPSPSTLARRIKAYRDWSWRPSGHEERKRKEGKLLLDWLEAGGTEQATERELDVFCALYVGGMSTRGAAKHLGISRDSVRAYRKRLFARMERSTDGQ